MPLHTRHLISLNRLFSNKPIVAVNRHTSETQLKYRIPALPERIVQQIADLKKDIVAEFSSQLTIPATEFGDFHLLPKENRRFQETDLHHEKIARTCFEPGGKYLTPTIVLLIAQVCNESVARSVRTKSELELANIKENQFKMAKIVEMIHTASLVHDDVVDKATIRRGKHSIYAEHGEKMAILIGDYILIRATRIASSIRPSEAVATFTRGMEDMAIGEILQIQQPSKSGTVEDYIHRIHMKTASYRGYAARSAAIIADADNSLQQIAFEYGRCMGIAYQIFDDLLNLTSSTENAGKSTMCDLKQGIVTLPIIYAMEQYPELSEMAERKFLNIDDVQRAVEIVLNSNAIEKAEQLAKSYANKAAQLASTLPNPEGAADALVAIAQTNWTNIKKNSS